VLARATAFSELDAPTQERELPALYLLFEHYLCEADSRPLSRVELRREVRRGFPELLASDTFGLILDPEPRQEILLCRFMLRQVLTRAAGLLGSTGGQSIAALLEWSASVPDTDAPAPAPAPRTESVGGDWVAHLGDVA